MKYRRFGRLDLDVSALGFGCMRFPTLNDDEGQIDEPQATEMLCYAIDRGVNYLDTAYPYHNQNSERFVGRALQDGYRDKVKLATKMPCWLVEKREDFDKFLNEQLDKLQTDHIDFYLLHGMWGERWTKMQGMNVFEWAEKAIADGRIGHLGFSFHDSFPVFKEIIDAYDWAMCQIQYNFMNEDVQAGTEGLEYAAEKGVAVVVMEPLLGGSLANPPASVQTIWKGANKNPVDIALRWLWNKPEVSVVLSGMSAMEHVQQNIESASTSGASTMSQDELDLIARVRDKYAEFNAIPCTKCGYCMPCPNGLDIPRNFELYNQAVMHNSPSLSRSLYSWHMPAEQRAEACIACRECEEQCPQQIEVSTWMPRVHEALIIEEEAA